MCTEHEKRNVTPNLQRDPRSSWHSVHSVQAMPACRALAESSPLGAPPFDNASSAEDFALPSMRLHGASSRGSSSIATRKRGSQPLSAMNSAFEYTLPRELSLLRQSAISESGTYAHVDLSHIAEDSSGGSVRNASIAAASARRDGGAVAGSVEAWGRAMEETESLSSTSGGFTQWGAARHVYARVPEIMYAEEIMHVPAIMHAAPPRRWIRLDDGAPVHGRYEATEPCTADGGRRQHGSVGADTVITLGGSSEGDILQRLDSSQHTAPWSGTGDSATLCAAGPDVEGRGGRVATGDPELAGRMRAATKQLDQFGPGDLFLGRFEMLGHKERRQGGAARRPFACTVAALPYAWSSMMPCAIAHAMARLC